MNLELESKLALVPIKFFCAAPNAQSVYLSGDFNDWNRTSHPMERQTDGCWFLQVPLSQGHHLYQFLVDGEPMLDPKAMGAVRNDWNEPASIIAVS